MYYVHVNVPPERNVNTQINSAAEFLQWKFWVKLSDVHHHKEVNRLPIKEADIALMTELCSYFDLLFIHTLKKKLQSTCNYKI